jgi:hypothetical protein
MQSQFDFGMRGPQCVPGSQGMRGPDGVDSYYLSNNYYSDPAQAQAEAQAQALDYDQVEFGGGKGGGERVGGGKPKKAPMSLKFAMDFVKKQRAKYEKKGVRLITLGNFQNRTKFKRMTGGMWDVYHGLAHHTKSGQTRQDLLLVKKSVKTRPGAAKRGVLKTFSQKLVSIRKWVGGVIQYAGNRKYMLPYQKKPVRLIHNPLTPAQIRKFFPGGFYLPGGKRYAPRKPVVASKRKYKPVVFPNGIPTAAQMKQYFIHANVVEQMKKKRS